MCPRCGESVQVLGEHFEPGSEKKAGLPPWNWERAFDECPCCGSSRIDTMHGTEFRERMKGVSAKSAERGEHNEPYVVFSPRECKRCSAIWMPPVRGWMGAIILVACGLLGAVCLLLWLAQHSHAPAAGVAFAIAGIVYGWSVMTGERGSGRVLREGDAAMIKAAKEPDKLRVKA